MDSRTGAIIDLTALQHNIKNLKHTLPHYTKLAAVVKADAYGHGALEVSQKAIESGASMLCFATAKETIPVLKADVRAPMLVMGAPMEDALDIIVDFEIHQCVFTQEHVRMIQKKAEEKKREAYVHVKIDTGMNRIGIKTMAEFETLMESLIECERVVFEGMFTHFAASDETDKSFSRQQMTTFSAFVDAAKAKGFSPILHAGNSGAIIDLPEYGFDFVRAGISLYGYYASDEVNKEKAALKPVMTVYSHVVHVKTVKAGESISYGRTFTAKKDVKVATVAIGYGDGLNRLLSNKGAMLVSGKRAPIVGRVCMDMTMVDVSDIENVKAGDTVIVIGSLGNEQITADEHATICGTISYEILLSFTGRVPREYKDEG